MPINSRGRSDVDPETCQALLECRPDLVAPSQAGASPAAELGCEDHVGAPTRDGSTDHLVAVAGSVDVRSVADLS